MEREVPAASEIRTNRPGMGIATRIPELVPVLHEDLAVTSPDQFLVGEWCAHYGPLSHYGYFGTEVFTTIALRMEEGRYTGSIEGALALSSDQAKLSKRGFIHLRKRMPWSGSGKEYNPMAVVKADLISGREVLRQVKEGLAPYRTLVQQTAGSVSIIRSGPTPALSDDPRSRQEASHGFANHKVQNFSFIGSEVKEAALPRNTGQLRFYNETRRANGGPDRVGIVQFPPPPHLPPGRCCRYRPEQGHRWPAGAALTPAGTRRSRWEHPGRAPDSRGTALKSP